MISSNLFDLQMEALSSLTFKGSVPEAIFEAKGQKKLFVVYISGKLMGFYFSLFRNSCWNSNMSGIVLEFCFSCSLI